MRTVLRLAGALALIAALAGCAAVRLAYENADLYAYWRAHQYLDLDGAEGRELRRHIDEFHAWHRAQALPKYARIAEEAGRRVGAGLSPQDMVWGYDSLLAQVKEGLREAAVRLAPLLDRLDAAQLARIEKGFAEDNRKFAREYLRGGEEDRRNRRIKRMVDRLENWVGRLSEPQVQRVRRFAEQVPPLDELRDRDRRRLQAGFLEIVRVREAQKRLPEFAAEWQRGRDPALVAASGAFRREFEAMLLDLDRTFTPGQRALAVARFRAYGEDFRTLSAGAPADRRP